MPSQSDCSINTRLQTLLRTHTAANRNVFVAGSIVVIVGLSVPIQGWTVDADYFRTDARNFFDHDVLENSNIFFPLTIDRARIRGFELAVRSPLVMKKRKEAHVVHLHYPEGKK